MLQHDVDGPECTVLVEDSLLSVAALECMDEYRFEEEDPGIYTDDEDDPTDKWVPRCEWPDKPMPVKQVQQPQPQVEANQAFIDHLMQQHHMNARVLESLEMDPCVEYKRFKVSSVLARVREGNMVCSICETTLSSTQALRSNIRSKHLEDAQFKCPDCNVSCGGAYALKVHMRVHTAGGKPHLCARCGKSFATVGHLNQHQEVHMGRTPSCQYCKKKTFTTTRALKDHEKRCSDRPDGPPAKKYKCDFCDAAYIQKKDLNCHKKAKKH